MLRQNVPCEWSYAFYWYISQNNHHVLRSTYYYLAALPLLASIRPPRINTAIKSLRTGHLRIHNLVERRHGAPLLDLVKRQISDFNSIIVVPKNMPSFSNTTFPYTILEGASLV